MWLFPSIAAEKREERSAAAREAVQVVREEKRKAVAWLRKRNLTWLIDKLVDGGPATEISLMFAAANEMSSMEEGAPVLMDVWALWRIGKLWRKSKGRHFGSGEETFLYGLRKVHSQNVQVCHLRDK